MKISTKKDADFDSKEWYSFLFSLIDDFLIKNQTILR